MSAYDDLHRQIREQYQQLSPHDIMDLIHELLDFYRIRVQMPATHSLRELRGLGAKTWEGIDAQEYVNEERRSWGR